MKKLALAGLLLVTGACNNSEPAATGYKNQLTGAPAAANGDQTPTPTPTPKAGDAAKGTALLTSSCKGCHNGDTALELGATEGTLIGDFQKAGGKLKNDDGSEKLLGGGGHSTTLNGNILTNASDLVAALGGSTAPAPTTGDATKGQAAFTASCGKCHPATARPLTKAEVAGIPGAAAKAYHSTVAEFKDAATLADITAYINTK